MDLSDDFIALDWPESFSVVYRDGTSERLLLGNGIMVTPPSDAPDGCGSFRADIPKKHPQNQQQGSRQVRFIDLEQIIDDSGNMVYRVPR